MTVGSTGQRHDQRRGSPRTHGERLARWSLGMLVAFALWTAAFVGLSGVVAGWLGADMTGGDVAYIREWLPWSAVTLLWVLPLVVGVVLGGRAVRAGAGREGTAALVLNSLILTLVVAPSLVDRLLHL
ncbi:hypothetical protein SAMN05216199_0016 [Pedococcus cremeus]|uniref:Uncharacterized protein n=1 Tax=Pedococcus cremeus TaxID=587636 RepID=A0A1H9XQB7_9MICO|nr:hypothetical protein [Pedococcus cremeus]SES47987.1 hypothetical protein SAMN05216199_0016 [Pedococcus cremeus]